MRLIWHRAFKEASVARNFILFDFRCKSFFVAVYILRDASSPYFFAHQFSFYITAPCVQSEAALDFSILRHFVHADWSTYHLHQQNPHGQTPRYYVARNSGLRQCYATCLPMCSGHFASVSLLCQKLFHTGPVEAIACYCGNVRRVFGMFGCFPLDVFQSLSQCSA